MARRGQLDPTDMLRVGICGPWIAARSVKGLFETPATSGSPSPLDALWAETCAASAAVDLPATRPGDWMPPTALPTKTEPRPPASAARPQARFRTTESPAAPSRPLSPPAPSGGHLAIGRPAMRREVTRIGFPAILLALLISATSFGLTVVTLLWTGQAVPVAGGPAVNELPAPVRPDQAFARWLDVQGMRDGKWHAARVQLAQLWLAQDALGGVCPPESLDAARFVFVRFRIANPSRDQVLAYRSWNAAEAAEAEGLPVMVDELGGRYRLVPPAETPAVMRQSCVQLPPGATLQDVLVFRAPTRQFDSLRLVLSRSAVGLEGPLVFQVSRTALPIVTAEQGDTSEPTGEAGGGVAIVGILETQSNTASVDDPHPASAGPPDQVHRQP